MDDLLGLPADLTTALLVVVTGVLIPAISALLNQPELSKTARRFIPIGLAAVGAAIVLVFRAGGPFAEQAATYVVLLATLVGIAQRSEERRVGKECRSRCWAAPWKREWSR